MKETGELLISSQPHCWLLIERKLKILLLFYSLNYWKYWYPWNVILDQSWILFMNINKEFKLAYIVVVFILLWYSFSLLVSSAHRCQVYCYADKHWMSPKFIWTQLVLHSLPVDLQIPFLLFFLWSPAFVEPNVTSTFRHDRFDIKSVVASTFRHGRHDIKSVGDIGGTTRLGLQVRLVIQRQEMTQTCRQHCYVNPFLCILWFKNWWMQVKFGLTTAAWMPRSGRPSSEYNNWNTEGLGKKIIDCNWKMALVDIASLIELFFFLMYISLHRSLNMINVCATLVLL